MTVGPTVIYLMGLPYSGTTLFALLLGKSIEIFNAGELNFAENDYHAHKTCSCGELVSRCEAWAPVIDAAREMANRGERTLLFTGSQDLRAIDARKGPIWKKVLKAVHAPPEWIYGRDEVVDYATRHATFIKTVAKERNVSFVLDASKTMARLKALDAHTDLEVTVMYVKRSILESYAARIKRAKRRDKSYNAIKSPFLLFEILIRVWLFQRAISRSPDARYIVIDYESFVGDPSTYERELSLKLGTNVDFQLRDHKFSVRNSHVWTGNVWLTRNAEANEEIELRQSDSIASLTKNEKAVYRIFSPVALWLDRRSN